MIKNRLRLAPPLAILAACLISTPVMAIKYGNGTYGNCTYTACSITLTTSGTVNLNVTAPSAAASCTTQSDTVAVLTHSGTGYSLTATNTAATTGLISGSNTIAASSGTTIAPIALSNSWGFRVDNLGSFGSGPTVAQSNGSASSVSFAGMPASSGSPDTLATTTSYSATAVNTLVWYGVCADNTVPSGVYTGSVLYTAVVNP